MGLNAACGASIAPSVRPAQVGQQPQDTASDNTWMLTPDASAADAAALARARAGEITLGTGAAVAVHTVVSGDTLGTIAPRYGTTVDAILQANRDKVTDPNVIFAGQQLAIPGAGGAPAPNPTQGPAPHAAHVVAPGETLGGIAARYGTSADAIFAANRDKLSNPNVIFGGQRLAIPGAGAPPAPAAPSGGADAAAAGGKLLWPIQGVISNGYSGGHKGIDIAAPEGTPIKAAGAGTVIQSQYGTGMYGANGNFTIIDHGNGLQSYYGHQSLREVQVGQHVDAGQEIGKVGHTGLATGSHVHFAVGQGGIWNVERNPMGYLA